MTEMENEEWIEASRLHAAANECRFTRIKDAAKRSAEKIIDLETTIGGLNLELIAAKDKIDGLREFVERGHSHLHDLVEKYEIQKSLSAGQFCTLVNLRNHFNSALEAKP